MGWLTKILRGSSHRLSEGYHQGKYRETRTCDEPRHSADGSDFDTEDIELALAISLSEHDPVMQPDEKEKSVIDHDSESDPESESDLDEEHIKSQLEEEENQRIIAWKEEEEEKRLAIAKKHEDEEQLAIAAQLEEENEKAKAQLEEDEKLCALAQIEEDEKLAIALQKRLTVESPPRHDDGNMYQPLPFMFPSNHRICAGCNAAIWNGRFLNCMGAVWHPECFRCHICNEPISDYEYLMSGNRPYHKSCYKEHHHPKCDVCFIFIPTNSAGLIEYRAHPFWVQKYCPSHERDGTPRCCSCERMEPKHTRYLILDDGRKLCLECLDSAIMDTNECQPLYLEIREFYEGLNMKVEQQIPLLLVERQALNEAMEGEKQGHHHLPETRGLCLSEEQTITTVLRRPRVGAGYRFIDMITEPYRLTRRCEVTAILILYGLPRLLTGSILAHEMMHAWLRLNGYPNLRPDVEEGICQVLAYMWLDTETYSGSGTDVASSSSSSSSVSSKKGLRSDFEKKLGEFFKHQIESDSSTAYGEGFRQGNRAVLKFGLRRVLDHIKMTGSFP